MGRTRRPRAVGSSSLMRYGILFEMTEHVIIDGNNLLYAMHEHAPIPHIGRESMVKLIHNWARRLPIEVTLVFDGPTPRGGLAKQMQPDGMTVRFSAPETADDIIVRMVQAAADPSRIHVVSSDTAIGYEARLRRCKHSTSVAFIASLFGPTEERRGSKTEPAEKPDVVSPEEADEWLDRFGNEKDEDKPFDGSDAMEF